MKKALAMKQGLACALAALALTAAAPALTSASALSRETPPSLTVDFSQHNDEGQTPETVGAVFGGEGVVKDADGKVIGKADDVCAKDDIRPDSDTVYCSGTIRIADKGDISVNADFPLSKDGQQHEFNGDVTGGTGAFDGVRGTAHFIERSKDVYDLTFDIR